MKTIFDTVDRLQETLDYHRERHTVLAGNVANVDTPGYVPFDLTLERLPSQSPAAAQGGNGGPLAGPPPKPSTRLVYSDPGAVGADGNAVSLERELAKIDANRIRYTATAELVSKRMALLKYAAGDGNG